MAKSTILVVDKEKILVDLLVRALTSGEIQAFGATSAQEAQQIIAAQEPALVVIDPAITDGFALLETVVHSTAKALVVSGSPDVAERAREAGAHEVVDRNAGLEALLEAIGRVLDAPFQVMGPSHGIRVLVADDEDEIRNVLCELLTAKGYNVRSARNGDEAVNAVKENPDLQVVLLDVSMPVMGGIEALKFIMDRDNPPGVIMLTAVSDREIARLALKSGAFDYILKPFDFALIDNGITACLSHKEFPKQPWWKRLAERQ